MAKRNFGHGTLASRGQHLFVLLREGHGWRIFRLDNGLSTRVTKTQATRQFGQFKNFRIESF